jgi:hypothetical protein
MVEVKVIMQVQEVCFKDTYFHLRMGTNPVPKTICSFEMSSHEPQKVPISFIQPVCPSACISTVPTGEIFMKFDIGDFYKHLLRNSKLGKFRQKYQVLHIPKTYVHLYC